MKRTQLYPLKFPLFYVAGRLDPCSARQQLILKALTASCFTPTQLSLCRVFFLTGHSLNEIWINPKSISSFLVAIGFDSISIIKSILDIFCIKHGP